MHDLVLTGGHSILLDKLSKIEMRNNMIYNFIERI